MGFPVLLYDNLGEDATVSASATATGYSVDNVTSRIIGKAGSTTHRWRSTDGGAASTQWIEFDLGSGGEQSADCLAITGHNLTTAENPNAIIALAAGSTSNPSDESTSYVTGSNWPGDQTIMISGQSGVFDTPRRYWRVTFQVLSTYVEIGALCLGQAIEFQGAMGWGFDPNPLKRESEFKGSTVSYVGDNPDHAWHPMSFRFQGDIKRSFMEQTGTPSVRDWIERKWWKGIPWWFSWDGDRTTINHYCRASGNDRWGEPFRSSVRQKPTLRFAARAENYG